VILPGIELHGIWIESQDFTNQLMEKFHFSSSRTTPIVFVPFRHMFTSVRKPPPMHAFFFRWITSEFAPFLKTYLK